jgi:hypothetical protein
MAGVARDVDRSWLKRNAGRQSITAQAYTLRFGLLAAQPKVSNAPAAALLGVTRPHRSKNRKIADEEDHSDEDHIR